MADQENTGSSPRDYISFSCEITYELQRLRFLADAASAMLGQHELAESDDTLVGTTYLLTDIASSATKLAERLDTNMHKFAGLANGQMTIAGDTPH